MLVPAPFPHMWHRQEPLCLSMLRLHWRPDLYEHLPECRIKSPSLAFRSDYSERAEFGFQAPLRDICPGGAVSRYTEVTYDGCLSLHLQSSGRSLETARHSQIKQVRMKRPHTTTGSQFMQTSWRDRAPRYTADLLSVSPWPTRKMPGY